MAGAKLVPDTPPLGHRIKRAAQRLTGTGPKDIELPSAAQQQREGDLSHLSEGQRKMVRRFPQGALRHLAKPRSPSK